MNWKLILLFFILFIEITIGTLLFVKSKVFFCLFLGVFLCQFLIYYEKPRIDFYTDKEYIACGANTSIYLTKDKNRVIKKIHSRRTTRTNKHNLFEHAISDIVIHNALESAERVKNELNHIKYFAKVLNVCFKKKEYIQEYIPGVVGIPKDLKKQWDELNNMLEKTGYILYDMHDDNIRFSQDGILKVIDPILLTTHELLFVRLVLEIQDPVPGLKNIYYNKTIPHKVFVDFLK